MLKDFIANAALLVSFLYASGEISKYSKLHRVEKTKNRFYAGIIAGILGCILMVYSVEVSSGVIVDLRQFALIIVAMSNGVVSTLIAGIMMSIFRIIYFGYSQSAILGAILILLISVLCGLIYKLKISEYKKWIIMNLSSIIAFSILIIATIERNAAIETLSYFVVICILVGVLVYYISKHIVLTNTLYFKYRKESTKDFLTGLYNVRNFDLSINEIIDKSDGVTSVVSMLMLDIDHFKYINDTYGHLVGDEVLKELAQVLKKSCRSTDYIARVGGEEFCAILMDCNSEMALEIAENIRKTVENQKFTAELISMTISIGVATYPETIHSVELIRSESDKALYYSKQNGRNQVNLNSNCR